MALWGGFWLGWYGFGVLEGGRMQLFLSIAMVIVLGTSLVIVGRWGRLILIGEMPTKLFAFIAILFTSGLDVGLIMFPLTEFPVYAAEPAYAFANPLAIEFGLWGFLIWALYFFTTVYFCVIEPRLKLFEITWVKFLNNAIIIATCAFTGFLFLQYLPVYIEGLGAPYQYGLVAIVVLCAVFSSTDIRYVKLLSIVSIWLFLALIFAMWFASGIGVTGFALSAAGLAEYFINIHRFVVPLTDYHAFYLFWWFAWSIMIGQFVSRFVGGLEVWQLLVALLICPSLLIAAWFSVLYGYYTQGIEVGGALNIAMVFVGIVFVVNSLDSLTRLYTENLGLTVERLGQKSYLVTHWSLLFSLILLYQFTPLKIEWIGLVVIGLYAAIAALTFHHRQQIPPVHEDEQFAA